MIFRLSDRTQFDDAHADRVAGEAGGLMNAELVLELMSVLIDRLDADGEFGSYLLVD